MPKFDTTPSLPTGVYVFNETEFLSLKQSPLDLCYIQYLPKVLETTSIFYCVFLFFVSFPECCTSSASFPKTIVIIWTGHREKRNPSSLPNIVPRGGGGVTGHGKNEIPNRYPTLFQGGGAEFAFENVRQSSKTFGSRGILKFQVNNSN